MDCYNGLHARSRCFTLAASLMLPWPSLAHAESPDGSSCPLSSTPPSHHRRALGYGKGKESKALREADEQGSVSSGLSVVWFTVPPNESTPKVSAFLNAGRGDAWCRFSHGQADNKSDCGHSLTGSDHSQPTPQASGPSGGCQQRLWHQALPCLRLCSPQAARRHVFLLSTTAQAGQGNGPLMVRASTEIAPAMWV